MEKEQLITLVKKSQSGDTVAIEKLLQYAHTSVSYQCRKMLSNEQDAEDMTQEVLVTIYTKLDTLQEPAAFHKWVNQITSSRCINALNRTHVEYQFAEDEEGHSILDTLEELDEQVIPDKAIDNAETVRMIEEIVGSLPDVQRAATLMFYYNEMSVKEIAQAMNVSENTVKSRLNYARKAIKEKVLDYEKQGVKLYGLSPLPFLLYFLRLAAQGSADKKAAGVMVAEVMATESAAAIAAGTGNAAATAGAGTATAVASGTAGSTVATGVFAGLSAKVVAGVLAAVVAIGSVVAVVIPNTQADTTEAPTPESIAESTEPETREQSTFPDETETPTETSTEETQPAACQHDYKSETVHPTCTSTGYTMNTCTKCGEVEKTDEISALGHAWDSGAIIQPATCETDGSSFYTCERNGCGETKTESIAALGHEYEEAVYNEPTCGMNGSRYYHCSRDGCPADYSEAIPATGHNWSDWVVVSEPTTEYNGEEMRECLNHGCDAIQTRSIDKLPSDETVSETVGEHTCEYEITDYKEPSCTEGGYTTMTCTICGDTQTQYKVALGHNFVDGTCTYCGETDSNYQASCNHVYDGGVENWPAGSMTWEPYIQYTCTLCGHTYTELIDYLS